MEWTLRLGVAALGSGRLIRHTVRGLDLPYAQVDIFYASPDMSQHDGKMSSFEGPALRSLAHIGVCTPCSQFALMPGDDYESTGLSSRFSFDKPMLWFARARLEDDAIVLTGWQLTGRYRRRIPLHKITQVDVPGTDRLLLWLTSGRTVQLRLPAAARWKRAIRNAQVEID